MVDNIRHRGKRERLVKELEEKGITQLAVLAAIGKVPRHFFVDGAFDDEAYLDKPLPILENQTISQPFTVASQTELLNLKPKMKVLEIGTGSGYQAAVLAEMGMRVFSVEIHRVLYLRAKEKLEDLGYDVFLRHGDGSEGWAQYQSYERILVTAACPKAPPALLQQLEIGGKMVLPIGTLKNQRMHVITRLSGQEYQTEMLDAYRFVPLRGKFGFSEEA